MKNKAKIIKAGWGASNAMRKGDLTGKGGIVRLMETVAIVLNNRNACHQADCESLSLNCTVNRIAFSTVLLLELKISLLLLPCDAVQL